MNHKQSLKWSKTLKTGVVCTVLDGILSGFNYYILFQIIEMIYHSDITMSKLIHAVTSLGIVYAIRLFIYGFGYTQAQLGGAKVSRDIRMALGNKLRKIPLAKFQQGQIGSYINISTNDVNNYEKILTHKVGDLAKNITLLTVIITITFILYRPAGFLLCIGALFLIPALYLSFYTVEKYGNEKNDICTEAVSSILEYITGIQVFRAYGAAGKHNTVTTNALKNYSDINYTFEKKVIPISTGLNLIHGICFPIILMLSYNSYVHNNLDTVSFILVAMLPVVYMKLCSGIFVDLTSYKNLAISKHKILSIFDMEEETGTKKDFCPNAYDIEFKNVNFEYIANEPVLKNVSFKAKSGCLTAIVGDSGSGKSTILNLMAKYYHPQTGTIQIDGTDIASLQPETLFGCMSILDQDIFLFHDTVKDNVRYANQNASDEDIIQACKAANCHSFISNLENGYDTILGENGSNLSGGERQRLSIARAILKDSPILLLDEATASLDIENELAVKNAILHLLNKQKTVIMVAHTLSIIKNADQILVVHDGRIVENGTHSSLLAKKGKYASMWHAEQSLSHI